MPVLKSVVDIILHRADGLPRRRHRYQQSGPLRNRRHHFYGEQKSAVPWDSVLQPGVLRVHAKSEPQQVQELPKRVRSGEVRNASFSVNARDFVLPCAFVAFMLACILPIRVFPRCVLGAPTVTKYCHSPLAVQLLDEGAVQMLRERSDDGNGNPILAAVGTLQFDGEFECSGHGSGAPVPVLD